MPAPHGTWKDLLPMLIGVLMIAAVALLVSAFLTGNTVLAGAALVISLGAAVLYVISLRRVPSSGTEAVASEAEASGEDASEEKVPATAAKADGKKADASTSPAEAKPAAKAPAEAKPAVKAPVAKAPAEAKPAAKAPVEAKPAVKAPVAKAPAEAKPAEVTSAEKKPAETKAPAAKAAEPKAAATSAVASTGNGAGTAPALAGTTVVHVVPGRMRYHVEGCQVIDGQEVEDLTVDDARDEGFTACSRCAARGRSHATA